MFFLTVYGPELESIFRYIYKYARKNGSISRNQLYGAYFPHQSATSKGQTKNLDDALHYLKAAKLLTLEGDSILLSEQDKIEASLPFSALLLRQLQQLKHHQEDLASLDRIYVTLLEQLYVLPNRIWLSDVHDAANQLDLAHQVGGISQEKINAWKRVMEFSGVGYRVGSGFYCLYQPELVSFIIRQWPQTDGTLQQFFEDYLQSWLPCLSARGEVALPVAYVLDQLDLEGRIHLYPKQDSPTKPYFNDRRLKGIQIL